MDKQTYEQIDRIEAKIDLVIQEIEEERVRNGTEEILNFLEIEVYEEKGRLRHLKEDLQLRNIFEELEGEEEAKREIRNNKEEEEEYIQE